MPPRMVLLLILIGILCTYTKVRTVWSYSTDKVYHYQLILKSVFFYTLMEYGALVNEMLLMMSGDVESNPGPCEYLYCTITPVPLLICPYGSIPCTPPQTLSK